MPAPHDRGGWPTDELIDQSEHEWLDWERETQAIYGLLVQNDLMVVDELRRGIESLPPDEYEDLSYFERWSASIETILVEKGVLTTEEIDAKLAEIDERWT